MKLFYLIEGVEGSLNLKKIYDNLNSKYFSGSLPKIKVTWSGRLKRAVGIAAVKYMGKVRPNPFARFMDEIPVSESLELRMDTLEIKISKAFNLQIPDLEAVMLHEMVHVELFLKKKIGGHHDSPEFQNRIKQLSGESGLKVPMKETDFKASPKLQAKEGYVLLIWTKTNQIGFTLYSKNFLTKNWLMFAKTIGRIVARSTKTEKVRMYKVKHALVSTSSPKRSLKGMSWTYTDEETAREIERDGKRFFYADKGGGAIAPQLAGIGKLKINSELKFNRYGEWINASEVL